MLAESNRRLLDGSGEFVPDEFLGSCVAVALALGDGATDSRETFTLGFLAVGRRCAARLVTFGGIDTGERCAVGTREGLEDDVAQFA